MNHPLKNLAFLGCILTAQSFAQTHSDLAAAQARYKQDMANCAVKSPVLDQRNCVKEARHALAEIRRGRMNESWPPSVFEKNELMRCDVHMGDDKLDCIARMHGRGKIRGSVAGGGILRELTTTTVISAPAPLAQLESKKAPEAIRPSGLMSNCRWIPPAEWLCK